VAQASFVESDRKAILAEIEAGLNAQQWRPLFGALQLLEYLVYNGSEALVHDLADGLHCDIIQKLSFIEKFQDVEDVRVTSMLAFHVQNVREQLRRLRPDIFEVVEVVRAAESRESPRLSCDSPRELVLCESKPPLLALTDAPKEESSDSEDDTPPTAHVAGSLILLSVGLYAIGEVGAQAFSEFASSPENLRTFADPLSALHAFPMTVPVAALSALTKPLTDLLLKRSALEMKRGALENGKVQEIEREGIVPAEEELGEEELDVS
jgi:hypothetical protein